MGNLKQILVCVLFCVGCFVKTSRSGWIEAKKRPIIVSVCENERIQLACEHGRTLIIIKAEFGRNRTSICHHHHQQFDNVHCLADVTYQLSRKCNNLRRCELMPQYNLAGYDPCPNIPKYLQVTSVCENSATLIQKPTFSTGIHFPLPPLPSFYLQFGV